MISNLHMTDSAPKQRLVHCTKIEPPWYKLNMQIIHVKTRPNKFD